MAADALTFRPQGYMDFVLIPGDEMALEDQNRLCVRSVYVCKEMEVTSVLIQSNQPALESCYVIIFHSMLT